MKMVSVSKWQCTARMTFFKKTGPRNSMPINLIVQINILLLHDLSP